MAYEIVPYREYEPEKLASELLHVVTDSFTQEMLTQRNLLGVIRRYSSDLQTAESYIKNGLNDPDLDPYVIVDESECIIGAASILKRLPLYKQRLPYIKVPAKLSRNMGLLKKEEIIGNNIAGWVTRGNEPELYNVYSRLIAESFFSRPVDIWTLEPVDSPVLERINSAFFLTDINDHKFLETNISRYDDGEVITGSLPVSWMFKLHGYKY